MAAHAAIKALENNTFDASSLRRYQRMWNQEFCKDFRLMHPLSKRWGKNIDHFIQIASGDKKLINIICEAIPKPGGVQQDKWKILFRFLYAACKNLVQQ